MLKIKYLIYKRLGKTDLDVLEDSEDNSTHTYIPIGRHKEWLDDLVNNEIVWRQEGRSDYASICIEAINGQPDYVEQELLFRVQHGAREGEAKFNNQRTSPILAWSKPVRDNRPEINTAYILLLSDQHGKYHARYLHSLDQVPAALRVKMSGRSSGVIDLRDEGGMILSNPAMAHIIEALKIHHNVILYGPPGTGKTWLMKQVQNCFTQGISPILFDETDISTPFKAEEGHIFPEGRTVKESIFVTFHQSMSYESLVVGLRPGISPKNGNLIYNISKGPFIKLAENALKDNGASLLLIDEINRGNTAEILGELITVMETNKRKDKDGTTAENTVQVMLPYIPESDAVSAEGIFEMPYHFYTLASMNSVDRSVAPLDSALRRRFQIIEIGPSIEQLKLQVQIVKTTLDPSEHDEWDRISYLACRFLEEVNRKVAVFKGPDFRLGHAYLWNVFSDDRASVVTRKKALIASFRDKIIPQLKEMFRDQQDLLKEILGGEKCEGKLFKYDSGADIEVENLLIEPIGWLDINDNLSTDEWLNAVEIISGVSAEGGWPEADEMELEENDEDESEAVVDDSSEENL